MPYNQGLNQLLGSNNFPALTFGMRDNPVADSLNSSFYQNLKGFILKPRARPEPATRPGPANRYSNFMQIRNMSQSQLEMAELARKDTTTHLFKSNNSMMNMRAPSTESNQCSVSKPVLTNNQGLEMKKTQSQMSFGMQPTTLKSHLSQVSIDLQPQEREPA